MNILHRLCIFLTAFGMLMPLSTAFGADILESRMQRCDYVEYQRVELSKVDHGFDGALLVTVDKPLTASGKDFSSAEERDSCKAVLDLLDTNGKKLETVKLGSKVAKIEVFQLLAGKRKTIALFEDHQIGLGSYSGQTTTFFDFQSGTMRQLDYLEEVDGVLKHLVVGNTLKSGWRTVQNGENRDIISLSCEPDLSSENDLAFSLKYNRFRFEDGRWKHYSRIEKGFWENVDGAFPDESLFPPRGPK